MKAVVFHGIGDVRATHPEEFFMQRVPVTSAIDGYHRFDQHEAGWLKVKLEPAQAQRAA